MSLCNGSYPPSPSKNTHSPKKLTVESSLTIAKRFRKWGRMWRPQNIKIARPLWDTMLLKDTGRVFQKYYLPAQRSCIGKLFRGNIGKEKHSQEVLKCDPSLQIVNYASFSLIWISPKTRYRQNFSSQQPKPRLQGSKGNFEGLNSSTPQASCQLEWFQRQCFHWKVPFPRCNI